MKLVLLLFFTLSSVIYAKNLNVKILEIDTLKSGNIIVAIFDSEDKWPELENALQVLKVDSKESKKSIIFNNLNDSVYYAIQVIHDYNLNDKIDINLNPFKGSLGPKEGVGLSNNYRPKFAPKFDGAKFLLGQSTYNIDIKLIYP